MNRTREEMIDDMEKWQPAFPTTQDMPGGGTLINAGAGMLDYFAARAMEGLIDRVPLYDDKGHYQGEMIAHESYCLAQKMMEERERLHPYNQES